MHKITDSFSDNLAYALIQRTLFITNKVMQKEVDKFECIIFSFEQDYKDDNAKNYLFYPKTETTIEWYGNPLKDRGPIFTDNEMYLDIAKHNNLDYFTKMEQKIIGILIDLEKEMIARENELNERRFKELAKHRPEAEKSDA